MLPIDRSMYPVNTMYVHQWILPLAPTLCVQYRHTHDQVFYMKPFLIFSRLADDMQIEPHDSIIRWLHMTSYPYPFRLKVMFGLLRPLGFAVVLLCPYSGTLLCRGTPHSALICLGCKFLPKIKERSTLTPGLIYECLKCCKGLLAVLSITAACRNGLWQWRAMWGNRKWSHQKLVIKNILASTYKKCVGASIPGQSLLRGFSSNSKRAAVNHRSCGCMACNLMAVRYWCSACQLGVSAPVLSFFVLQPFVVFAMVH